MVKKNSGLGSRYGRKVRHTYMHILEQQKSDYECPKCFRKTIKRESKGVWHCKKCDHKFAGGAFRPDTNAKKLLRQALRRSEKKL